MVITVMPLEDVDDESYATAADEQPEADDLKGMRAMNLAISINNTDDNKEDSGPPEDPLTLPESTHSFLFTEPVCSLPFVFSVGIAALSYLCLVLALINNIKSGSGVPTNVDLSVRIAQYLSILIALLMEEEIPTGLYLLRRVSKPCLKNQFPSVSYPKFVLSNILRITMGYLFLVNVVVVLAFADEVLSIFYDVLALQFIQKLDDIGFSISKMEVLGERLQRATMTPFFHVDFQKDQASIGLKWRIRMFLKTIYFVNLAGFLSAMIVVSMRQITGYYQCDSITLRFGDEIWQDAIVKWPTYSQQYPPGLVENFFLAYSFFDGVYAKHPTRTSQGRPVYIEQKKSDRTAFDIITPTKDPYHRGIVKVFDPVKPAEIKYCEGYWIFSHEFVHKSLRDDKNDGCQWLARSHETNGFDLLDVANENKWKIWTGKIIDTDISIQCNKCSEDTDCNLNGVCNEDGKCKCNVDEGVEYLGTHCEVELKDTCRIIHGEQYNDTWTVDSAGAYSDEALAWNGQPNDSFQLYSRPVYSYVNGLPGGLPHHDPGVDSFSLIYSGRRWFLILMRSAKSTEYAHFWACLTSNYHGLWSRAYTPGVTTLVSEPTYKDTPVGVDFYHVGERGNQYGSFGALYSAQKWNITGRGLFRCHQTFCSFCPNGLTVDVNYVIQDNFPNPTAHGYTCVFMREYATAVTEGSLACQDVQTTEEVCCSPDQRND